VILDVNALAVGERFMSVGVRQVSDDGNLLAYTTDHTGFRDYTLHVKDLRTGKLGSERVERVASVAWAPDNRTLFYTTTDPAKRPHRLYRHALGADTKGDALLYEEKDEKFRVGVYRTRSGDYLIFPVDSHTTSEVRYLKASDPQETLSLIAPRVQEREYAVDHRGDLFYIWTNDRGRNYRIVTAPVSDPKPENWKELIPHRDDVMIDDFDAFANWLVVVEREDALPRIRVMDLKTGSSYRIEFPEAIYSVGPENNREFDTATLRYEYESFTTPTSIYDYDMAAPRKLLKQREVLGNYDPSLYV
jgi:oligopeptidase B